MKIGLIDVHDVKYDAIYDISRPLKEAYCKKHGYECFLYKTSELRVPQTRQENWLRVQGILYHLHEVDWLFYLDTDILILNDTIKVEDYIDEAYNLIAGPLPHEGHIMTSGMLIKNCRWSYEFFLDLFAQTQFIDNEYKNEKYFEQSAFHYLYDTEEKYREKIKLVPRNWFNSEYGSYQQGDFLIHFPGQHYKAKLMASMLQGGYAAVEEKACPLSHSTLEQLKFVQDRYFKFKEKQAARKAHGLMSDTSLGRNQSKNSA